jgi:hypothetical protein
VAYIYNGKVVACIIDGHVQIRNQQPYDIYRVRSTYNLRMIRNLDRQRLVDGYGSELNNLPATIFSVSEFVLQDKNAK